MNRLNKLIYLSLVILITMGISFAQNGEKIHKEFPAKESVRISTVSGNCIVKQGAADKILVDIQYSSRLKGSYKPEFNERSSSLKLKEQWSGSSSSGNVSWTITVPPKTEIEFSTASGDFEVVDAEISLEASTASGEIQIEDSKGKYDVSTASGDVEGRNVSGEMEISTASGEIDFKNSKGTFELSCASGDINANGITIEEESSFSTASGDVEVILAKSSEHDLELSAASGNVILDFDGNPIKGYFEFNTNKRRGKISSPIKFDREEEFGRNGNEYTKKSFTKGSKNPKIYLQTDSGKASLKE